MQLTVTTLSGSKTSLSIDPSTCTVEALGDLVSKQLTLPRDRLKIVAKGQPLSAASLTALQDGDGILAILAPRPPPQELRQLAEGGEMEEEDELDRFRLPADAASWQRHLARFLQQKLRLPEVLLVLLFSLHRNVWLGLLGWWAGVRVANYYDVGPLYFVTSVFVLILLNLGHRREGEASAYSIFNNFQRLPGQLTAEQLDDQVRRGHMG